MNSLCSPIDKTSAVTVSTEQSERQSEKPVAQQAITQHANHLSYQIVINAYLRKCENTWQYFNKKPPHISDLSNRWHHSGLGENSAVIHIQLPQQQHEILIAVRYFSLTLRHHFHFSILSRSTHQKKWFPLSLSHFICLTMSEFGQQAQRGEGELDTLVLRCFLSMNNTKAFIQQRYQDLITINDGRPLSFIDSEQSLVVGHQLHPIAKSREEFSSTDLQQYSPETAGRFQLHYFAISTDYIHQDSALNVDSVSIIKNLLQDQLIDVEIINPEIQQRLNDQHCALIPVHPWQAPYLRNQQQVKSLEADGVLDYLGHLGTEFTATTSIRTVFNQDCPFMFKFSLNVRITNSE